MSVHWIETRNGVKMMHPILTEREYREKRDGGSQKANVFSIRKGNEGLKHKLVQMNYSCLPNDDGTLKGSKRMSNAVGMDVDHIEPEQMQAVKENILSKAAELGLLMLEQSAREEGYHLVFRRRPELSQEDNLKWASELLGVEYDDKAKDITRVFFTTTSSAEDLIYLDDAIFDNSGPTPLPLHKGGECIAAMRTETPTTQPVNGVTTPPPCGEVGRGSGSASYNGLPYADIIAKYWELFNGGKEPVEGDRNALTFELAVTIRSICGYSLEKILTIIPNYWGDNGEEWR